MTRITYTDKTLEVIDMFKRGELHDRCDVYRELIDENSTEGDKSAVDYLYTLLRAEVL